MEAVCRWGCVVRWPELVSAAAPPPVPRASGRGSAHRMYRSILAAHTCILLSLACFTALPWVAREGWWEPTSAERLSIAAVYLVVATDLQRRGERLSQLVLLAIVFLLATPTLGTHALPGDSTVSMMLAAIAIMAARLLPLATALGLAAGLGLVHVAGTRVLGLPPADLSSDAMVLALGTAAAAVAYVNVMQSSAIATDAAADANREGELALADREAAMAAASTSRRVLHDDVLGTLHLVSDAVAPPEKVRLQCGAAAATVREVLRTAARPTPGEQDGDDPAGEELGESYASLVAQLRGAAHPSVEVMVDGRTSRLPRLSDGQVRVIGRAVAEGMRNAARHGGVDTVELRISADRREVRFELGDRGSGLRAGHRAGFGLRESVERPLAAIGGRSALVARPGGGAVLVMAVPRGGEQDAARALPATDGLGSVRRAPRAMAVPLGAAWTVVALHSTWAHPGTWPLLLVGLGWLAAAAAVVHRSERSVPRPAWVATMWCFLVALLVAGIALLPDGAMLDYRSWTIGMNAVPIVVFVLIVPAPVGAALVVVNVLVVLAAAQVRPELADGLVPWGSLNSVVTCPVPSLVLGALIRRKGRELRAERRREVSLEQRRAEEEWQAAMADLYFTHVAREVLPWLDDVASGRLRADAPATVAHARLLAAAARDDLYAPGFFDEGLREEVSRFRSGGGTIELRAGLAPGGHQRAVGRVLRALLAISTGRRIIVTPPGQDGRRVRIAVVPAPGGDDLERLRATIDPAVEADLDDFRAVLLVDDLPGSGERQ